MASSETKSSISKAAISVKNIIFLAVGLVVGLFLGLFLPGRVIKHFRYGNRLEYTAFPVPDAKSLIAEKLEESGLQSNYGNPGSIGAFHEFISTDKTAVI